MRLILLGAESTAFLPDQCRSFLPTIAKVFFLITAGVSSELLLKLFSTTALLLSVHQSSPDFYLIIQPIVIPASSSKGANQTL
ncbi:hypothetical protein IEQ34_017777 [Dendrobium chrysotoxum]|uniref:Uncharacterized protein n=1 Tax=Dendrobium chrysotoxum TaxID=161865 RepID=A0AAV7GDJ2_DENCH|nr:hypothetical protein IEQ34_017777 [Dendrobium chrysotoxum]